MCHGSCIKDSLFVSPTPTNNSFKPSSNMKFSLLAITACFVLRGAAAPTPQATAPAPISGHITRTEGLNLRAPKAEDAKAVIARDSEPIDALELFDELKIRSTPQNPNNRVITTSGVAYMSPTLLTTTKPFS